METYLKDLNKPIKHKLLIMGQYSSFIPSKSVAISYFNGLQNNDFLRPFWTSFHEFCNKHNLSYETKNGDCEIKISTNNFILYIELKQDGEVSRIRIFGMGRLVKTMRDSIWLTKTFFSLPVLCVLNTSSDDESYWEDFPRNFMVSIYTKEYIALTPQYNY